MKKKMVVIFISILILVIAVSILFAFQEPGINSECENWASISNTLRCFLEDPLANYSDLVQIEDLYYWINIYTEIYGGNYLAELFSKHFQVNKIDSQTLDVIFYLLIKYSRPSNWDIKQITERVIEVIESKPQWFARELINRSDWKEILRLIALNRTSSLKYYFSYIQYQEQRANVLGFLDELEAKKRTEVQRLEEFLKDPVNNFDKIKDIYFICSVMALHDWSYINEDKILPPEHFSPGIIADYIKENPDEKKIDLLIHMISSCTTAGLESEVIMELGSGVFLEHPGLLAKCLSKYKGWRSIVYLISDFLYHKDPGFKKVINSLGNSDFENRLKSQLNFISSVIEKKHEMRKGL